MERSVVQGGLEVAEWVASQYAFGRRLANALLDAGEEVLGHGAADHVLGELHAATRVRLDRNPDVAEHAVAARLLLVAAVRLGLAADRLLVGDPGRLGHDGGAELALEPLANDGNVGIAHGHQDLLRSEE